MNPSPTPTPLQLRIAGAPAPSGDAWFVPGARASHWLDELVHFGVDLTTTFLLPVPTSRADRTPIGAVVVLPEGVVPHRHERATPWRRRGARVFVPADAELWPPVGDDELAQLVGDRWLVWHPSAGLVAYAAHERLPVPSLLQVVRDDAIWDRARPGLAVVALLRSVAPELPPTVAMVFEAERREIGSQTPGELPPLPDEQPPRRRAWSPKGLRDVGLDGLARAALHLFTSPDATRQATGWMQRLLQWASDRLARSGPRRTADQERRDRELRRLMELLHSDPERGLRHALPLGGPPGRGLALPGNRLDERATDFSLGALGGGGPVDAWHVDGVMRQKLVDRYRELANAEIVRGNHRRAAYILAHLLGDLHAAAQCLRDGRQFREAATLYAERLGQPEQAAACLVAGGWLGEAAALFEQMGQWEKVGDLRLLQGQADGAAEVYARVVAERLACGDVLRAALVQAEKLFDVPGALATLAQHVQNIGDAHCLAAWLALAQRSGGDAAVAAGLSQLLDSQSVEAGVALQVLAAFAYRARDADLRALLRDRARVAVAQLLAERQPLEQSPGLLRSVQKLSPEDPLLGRDLRAMVFSLAAAAQLVGSKAPAGPARGKLLRRWQRVGTFAGRCLCALFGGWIVSASGDRGKPGWRLVPLDPDQGEQAVQGPTTVQMCTAPDGGALYGIASDQGPTDMVVRLDSPVDARVATVLRGQDAHAIAVASDGSFWLATDGEIVARNLGQFDREGQLLRGELLPQYETEPGEWTELRVVGDAVVCVRGKQVAVRDASGTWHVELVRDTVIGVAARPESGATCIGLAFRHGFAVLDVARVHLGLTACTMLEVGMDAPALGWTRNGFLVAVDEATAVVCRGGTTVQKLRSERFTHGRPLTILPMSAPDELLFVAEQTITCYAVR